MAVAIGDAPQPETGGAAGDCGGCCVFRANPDAGPLAYLLLRGEGKRRTQADPAGWASFLCVLILPLFGVRPCPRLRESHCAACPSALALVPGLVLACEPVELGRVCLVAAVDAAQAARAFRTRRELLRERTSRTADGICRQADTRPEGQRVPRRGRRVGSAKERRREHRRRAPWTRRCAPRSNGPARWNHLQRQHHELLGRRNDGARI